MIIESPATAGLFYFKLTTPGDKRYHFNPSSNSQVYDLNYHQPTRILVARTHQRSLFEFNLGSITSVEGDNIIIVGDFELY